MRWGTVDLDAGHVGELNAAECCSIHSGISEVEEGGGIGRKGNGEGEGGNGRNMEEVSCKQREIGSEENDKQNRKTERKEPKYKS